jgi:hypothetical protein
LTGVADDPSPVLVLEEVEVEVVVLALCEVAVMPGMVAALTAPNTPTPASAPTAAPVVSRLSRRNAASRARILFWVLVSMALVLTRPLKHLLEEAETLLRAVNPGDTRIRQSDAGFLQLPNPHWTVGCGLSLTQ